MYSGLLEVKDEVPFTTTELAGWQRALAVAFENLETGGTVFNLISWN